MGRRRKIPEGSDYSDVTWETKGGEFDWDSVFKSVSEEDRDAGFWDWFREQYS